MRRRSLLLAAGAAALSGPPAGRAFAASRSGPLVDHGTAVDLDGGEHVDLSSHVGAPAPLSTGTILVTFRTTSHDNAMTLISASDPAAPSSNLTLSLSGGALQFSVRRQGAVLINVMTRTRYDDGLQPDERGHHRIALKMIKDLQIFDTGSRVCALSIP
ncbi:hypothetical protein ACFYQ5_11245 [Streptomyces sp. NPDC005794]|uniref:hypothetical protein n=1 Tax=Streptomyces sp. NPDC005794 TaxID=3364733 RepID=UPI0036BAF15B